MKLSPYPRMDLIRHPEGNERSHSIQEILRYAIAQNIV